MKKTFKLKIVTSHDTYTRLYEARDLNQAWMKVDAEYRKGDAFVLAGSEMRISIPYHAALEVSVQEES